MPSHRFLQLDVFTDEAFCGNPLAVFPEAEEISDERMMQIAREGLVQPPDGGTGWQRIHHEVGIGVLPVDIEFQDGKPVQVVMTQGKFQILDEIDDGHEQAELARALGLAREELDETLPIQVITTGLSCLAVPIRSLAD